ncbi:MAG: tRNA 2-selenouridine(34) synthase MnmH [Bacteroidia bacterium]|nr:tRNA 2-selenouridine(34) synthase MnmH [Bacteroidia bacterium]
MIKKLEINEFIAGSKNHVLIDARSESEHAKGHIPNACNLPILCNEHRVIIGTLYKQQGREAAVHKGFELVGPLFASFIDTANLLAPQRVVYIYCARGGMRSNILAWVLGMAGFKVYVLEGGYKKFRNYVLATFTAPLNLIVLGGKTGSGKTELLNQLPYSASYTTIDLEGLANHKGSAYGGIDMPAQGTHENFENRLATIINSQTPQHYFIVENESIAIGQLRLPRAVYVQMQAAPIVELLLPYDLRLMRIAHEYGELNKEQLITQTKTLTKRLGGLNTQLAVDAITNNECNVWIALLMQYYDKCYTNGLQNYKNTTHIKLEIDHNFNSNLSKLSTVIRQLTSISN